ncbi:MAG: DUF4157 domain-containing protein [Bacteroidia bacterium]|nr:DUF4157 domain-containing protein [Bacteroidia bacterium]
MMDIGDLRWGACEFSGRSNGDVHHFDLGTKHHSPAPAPAPAPAETTGTEGGEAPVTRKEATPAQMQAGTESGNGNPNRTGLPNNLKAGVEELSGISMDGVTVHYNSNKPAQVQALAYAQGTDIHIGPGQEKHLPHEAWHIVQQKQGRVKPTTEAGGMPVNDDRGLETEADVMGAKALQLGARESGQETSQGENAAVQQQKSVAQRQFMGPPAPTGAGADFDQYMLQLQGLEAAASADGFSLNQTITAFRKLYYNSGGWNTIIAGAAAQGFPPSWLVAGSTEAGAAAYITAHKEIAINGTTVDVGHLLTGLDAANHPASLSYAGGLVNLRSNQEAATYVGDLGSVVTEYVAVAPRDWVGLVELDYPLLSTTYTSYAEDVDMAGNVDSYSITMDPTKSLSQNLLDYYTSTSGGATKRYTSFARSIGLGTLRGGTFTGDTPAFRTALRDEIYNFAIAYLGGTRGKWGAITNWGGTVNYSNVADWVVIIFMVKLASKVASE